MSHHYTLLNLNRSATEAEILSAYRKLSLKCHPDKGGDAASFHRLSEAKDFCLQQLELQAASPPTPPKRPWAYSANFSDASRAADDSDSSSDIPSQAWRTPSLAKTVSRAFARRREAKMRAQARKVKEELEKREHDIMAQARYYTDLQQKLREQGVKC